MKFEYDPEKSRVNKTKHGIDFDEAQVLWNDPIYWKSQPKKWMNRDIWL